MCDSTSLAVGSRYVILVYSVGRNDVYRASVTMQADWLELPNYTRACGLQKMYPIGTNTHKNLLLRLARYNTINVKNCSLYTLLTATDLKPQKS